MITWIFSTSIRMQPHDAWLYLDDGPLEVEKTVKTLAPFDNDTPWAWASWARTMKAHPVSSRKALMAAWPKQTVPPPRKRFAKTRLVEIRFLLFNRGI